MNKENIRSKKICPYYWRKNMGDSSVMKSENNRKCILKQVKGWKACVYHAKDKDIGLTKKNMNKRVINNINYQSTEIINNHE